MTNEYVTFLKRDSWWVYGVEGFPDTVRWHAISAISGITDGSTIGGGHRYELLNASIGRLPDIGYYECNISCSAGKFSDRTTLSANLQFTILSTDSTITRDGALPLENGVKVDGTEYNDVLHLHNESSRFKEVWIAPNVGIIKMTRGDDRTFYLKNFKF